MLEAFFLRLDEWNTQQYNSYLWYCHSETADRRYPNSVQQRPTQTLCYSRNNGFMSVDCLKYKEREHYQSAIWLCCRMLLHQDVFNSLYCFKNHHLLMYFVCNWMLFMLFSIFTLVRKKHQNGFTMINDGGICLPCFLLEWESVLLIWRGIGKKAAMLRKRWGLWSISWNSWKILFAGDIHRLLIQKLFTLIFSVFSQLLNVACMLRVF